MDEKALEAAVAAYVKAGNMDGAHIDPAFCLERMRPAIIAYLQARREAGFVEVPVEPTPEMHKAARMNNGGRFDNAYRAMIDAWLASLA